MRVDRQPPVLTTLRPSDHPYLSGPWTPLTEEVDAEDLEVLEGVVPTDLDGVYLRNTENQVHEPAGRHHPFDGDGMIHAIDFRHGAARYRNRFIRTTCFEEEQAEGRSLWGGLMDGPGVSDRPGFGAHGRLKDAASTDVLVHAGKAVATFYQCGEAWLLDPVTLETLGAAEWTPRDGVSAHPKLDPRTGELLFFNYSKRAPHMHYGEVDAAGRLSRYIPVPLAGPRLPHDMAFTQNYAILNDLPMFWDAKLLERDIHAVRLHPGLPSRFALVPRGSGARMGDDIRWFEAAPCYVLHWVNAYEDGEEVILDGYFQEDPTPKVNPNAVPGHEHLMTYLDMHSFRSRLHRWRFNLRDGTTREERLDDRVLEFGTMNQRFAGRPYRYAYSTTARPGWFLFNGFVKHDLQTGQSWTVQMEDGRYGSEAPFCPRIGAVDEDDGYLVSFVTDETAGTGECILIDAKRFADGPVCRLALPHKPCSGTHAVWADRREL